MTLSSTLSPAPLNGVRAGVTGVKGAAGNGLAAAETCLGKDGPLNSSFGRRPPPEDDCSICGARADCEIDGVIVSGHFGSSHDLRRLVWIGAPDDAPSQGGLCDDCVRKACETGCLEAFGEVTDQDGRSSVPSPSMAAYAALFAAGFHDIDTLIHAETGGLCEPQHPPRADRLALIARLRAVVAGNAVDTSAHRVDMASGWQAIDAGRAHALATRAIGVRMDPVALTACARDWAAARKALDEEAEKLSASLLSIF